MSDTLVRVLLLAGRGYCCSQILGLLALEAQGRENPDFVRALGGLCHGQGGGTCGILTGGACVLALYLGKGADSEEPMERADLVQAEFTDWFCGRVEGRYGGITCATILVEEGGRPDVSRCADLLSEAWERILGLLAKLGLDPSQPRSA